MLTDKLIFSGVQFNHTRDYHTKDFDKTDIKTFMDRHLARDLDQSRGTITLGEQTEETEEFKPRKSRLQKFTICWFNRFTVRLLCQIVLPQNY